jgi:hypothetical protein
MDLLAKLQGVLACNQSGGDGSYLVQKILQF